MSIKTNWYVITGGPCSGKTKVIERLAFLGYATVSEAARALIDRERNIRADEAAFQKKVFQIKIAAEDKLLLEQITFFDRGIPDSIAYYKFSELDSTPVVKESQKRKYKGIFYLEQLPFEKDYARVEDEKTSSELSGLLIEAYQSLGYEVVRVPVKPVEERVRFILKRIMIQ